MNKHFRINILAFMIAFVSGIIYVYMDVPKQRVIIKYPTPYNSNKLVYKGIDDNCYKFNVKEVECTQDAIKQPIV
jgi:hypothetical protein